MPDAGPRLIRRGAAILAAAIAAPAWGGAALAQQAPADAGALPGAAPATVAAPAPSGASATPAAPAAAPAGSTPAADNPAIAALLRQAGFWRDQHQPDRALAALRRVLGIDPHNATALAMQAEIEAAQGDAASARATLARIGAATGATPGLRAAREAVRLAGIDPEQLATARRLASEHRAAAAVAAYRQAFAGGAPPDALAVEYYQTLASTEGGWDAARAGLAQAVRHDPGNLKAQLAYAELLTYREASRAEGIRRLQALGADPSVAAAAEKAQRQALLWLADRPDSAAAIGQFAATHPDDAEIAHKLAAIRNPPNAAVDRAGQDRAAGFAALNAGHLAEAEQHFSAALMAAPDDADALGGLGLVRLRQGRPADARLLLQRAIAADPSARDKWQAALVGTESGQDWAEVRALAARGQYRAAEAKLTRLLGRSDNPGGRLLLADIQTRAGELAAAEASYRRVLDRRPEDTAALIGLAGLLSRQGQDEEAAALYARAGASGGALAATARAAALRDRATQAADPATRIALYRAALASDPGNAWIRLDLARALAGQGQRAEAQRLIDDAIAGPQATPAALQAAAYFDLENGNATGAAAAVARLPPRQRTPEMRRLAARVAFQREVDAAAASGPVAGRARLMRLAVGPDPDGTRGAAIARAFAAMHDPAGAQEAINLALAATPMPSPAQRLAYAGAMMQAGDAGAAARLLAGIDVAALPPDEAAAAVQLRAGLAVQRADRLRDAGQPAAAYDQLAPVLRQDPANADANLALARLYQSADRPQRALAVTQALLQRNPNDVAVRQAAVQAAIAARAWGQAQQWVQQGLRLAPADPRSWIAAADLARARGNDGEALRDLRRARALRSAEVEGAADSVAATEAAAAASPDAVPAGLLAPDGAGATAPDAAATGGTSPAAAPPPTGPALAALPPGGGGSAAIPTGGVSAYMTTTAPAPLQPPAPGSNPFRAGAAAPADADGTADAGAATGDAMTENIDRQIAAMQEQVAPRLQVDTGLRFRSGSEGLDQLTEAMLPMEASFSPGGVGRVTFQVTPTYVTAGTLPDTPTSLAQFGTLALDDGSPSTPSPGTVQSSGVGLDLGYAWRFLSADVGATPLGFRVTNPVGGIELAPEIANGWRVRLTGEDRAVTDSVLSYAGTRDPRTGEVWGGVTRARGHIQIEYAGGPANFYLGGGGASLTGKNVESNSEVEFGAGGSYAVYHSGGDEARVGLDLVYFDYAHNLRFFTLGGGGYFSPQNYFAALIPVSYAEKDGDLTWNVGGSVGFQTYHENSSPYFPTDPAAQAQLEALAAGNPQLAASTTADSVSGLVGGAHGAVEYRVSPAFTLGGRASYQRAGDWNEGEGLLYARYLFNVAP
ncbi:MAG TPA: cellulose synthase subunit BcsC-related outer membrane protein [Acetobacteraceae bacterium]|nr:cellulose synthase subunit BcsC-related outer membrane protein [Acetobacteraceae bacterium]